MDEEEEFLFPKFMRNEACFRFRELSPEAYKESVNIYLATQIPLAEKEFRRNLAEIRAAVHALDFHNRPARAWPRPKRLWMPSDPGWGSISNWRIGSCILPRGASNKNCTPTRRRAIPGTRAGIEGPGMPGGRPLPWPCSVIRNLPDFLRSRPGTCAKAFPAPAHIGRRIEAFHMDTRPASLASLVSTYS